ncbi:MAG: nucleotidyltransferase family protein [Actinomycetota bacterium]
MRGWEHTLLRLPATMVEVIKHVDANEAKIALVVDENNRLLGTVTDGDIRRALLREVRFDASVTEVMNTSPKAMRLGESREAVKAMMAAQWLRYIPIVDDSGRVVGLDAIEEMLADGAPRDNWVVIMAGGLGTRLRPLTDKLPKPLLKIGDKPLLQIIIETLISQNFRHFFISVNYKADMIKREFGDGRSMGVEIRYLEEEEPLGTAGALSLLPGKPEQPVLVMNGDLLTKVSFGDLLDYHSDQRAAATLCVREYGLQVPYGVIGLDGQMVVSIDEKPVQRLFVNAGIYVLSPEVLDSLKNGQTLDMPDVFNKLIDAGQNVAAFPIREFWLDIGQPNDYAMANEIYLEHFDAK